MIEKQKALDIIIQQMSQLPRDHESEIALHALQQAHDQINALQDPPAFPAIVALVQGHRGLATDEDILQGVLGKFDVLDSVTAFIVKKEEEK